MLRGWGLHYCRAEIPPGQEILWTVPLRLLEGTASGAGRMLYKMQASHLGIVGENPKREQQST